MRIALVHCPLGHRGFSENVKVVDEEFCLAPPIILAYVAAILEQAGHQVLIVEANALKLTLAQALARIQEFSPDVIGFRADSYWFHRAAEWAEYFRSRTKAVIVVGGINVTLYPQESLSYRCFDFGICGEANTAFPRLLAALEAGDAVDRIPGIVYRIGDEVRVNPPASAPIPFEEYPYPARHLLPNHLYSSFTSQRKNFTVMLTNTGCPYGCSFCAITRLPFRTRSVQSVIGEIEQCYREFGVREIDFFSPTFFPDREFVLGLCREIVRRGLDIEWSCRSRVDQVDRELLAAVRSAGCRKIYYGIESSSEQVLDAVSKGITSAQVREALRLTREAGIMSLGFFMVGNPGDTRESIKDAIRFARSLPLDYIQVCRTIAKPNTGLHDLVKRVTGIDPWQRYILTRDESVFSSTPWTELSSEEVTGLVKRFYREFYFRPAYLLRRLSRIRSAGELLRYCRAGVKWFSANGESRGKAGRRT
jgi:anaerobic magnesium-protoporphyrin IX monomethyl ester cyclase